MFPQVAKDECRFAILGDPVDGPPQKLDLPAGTYGFLEFYCDDPDCDCRRVMLNVFQPEKPGFVAVISYGFDPGTELRGPFLDPINKQSEYAEAALDLCRFVLQDAAYVARLESHYRMVKDAVGPGRRKPASDKRWWQRRPRKPKKK